MNYDEVKLRRLIGKCQWTFAKCLVLEKVDTV